ncbi:MAG: hypothetical protein LUD01_08670 [Clostridiales bacterium]|nr:hypothetical protein [Clostridiales bacterium]
MDKEQRRWARDEFAHFGQEFEPVLIHEDDNFFIMDWRDRNGSGNLATRYIVDKEKGDLIIKGDAGDCIASWYNQVTPENLVCYINSTYYFVEKIQCSSNKYTYEWSDVREDLNDKKQEFLGLYEDGELNDDISGFDIEEDFAEMEDILSGLDLNDNTVYPDNLTDLFQKYDSDWFESFTGLGKRIDKRVYLWTYGFQEGVERLRGKEFVRKDR